MKIGFFITRYAPVFSGQALQIERIGRHLKMLGADFFVITYRFKGLPAYEVVDGVRVFRISPLLPGKLGTVIYNIRSALMVLRLKNEFDILHVHSISVGRYSAMLAARILGKKTVFEMTLAGADDPEAIAAHSPWAAVELSFFRLFDRYFAISEALARSYERMGFPAEKLWRLEKGVDTARYSPPDDKSPIRKDLELPLDKPLVCFVGAVVKRKGVDVLMDAWLQVAAQDSEAVLVIVGPDSFHGFDGPDVIEFGEQAKALAEGELRGRVIFTGMTDKVDQYLKASDFFVFPSRAEGMPAAPLEALSCGLPSVIARMEGITEQVIEDGKSGIIVPQNDAGALADALLTLLRDPQRAAELGKNARERALKLFSVERAAEHLIGYYRQMLSASG